MTRGRRKARRSPTTKTRQMSDRAARGTSRRLNEEGALSAPSFHLSGKVLFPISSTIFWLAKLLGSTLRARQSFRNSSTLISLYPFKTYHNLFLSVPMRLASSAMLMPRACGNAPSSRRCRLHRPCLIVLSYRNSFLCASTAAQWRKSRHQYPVGRRSASCRMKRACELLSDADPSIGCPSNQSVAQVATLVGFRHASSFIAAFKRHMGVTPTEWRASCFCKDCD